MKQKVWCTCEVVAVVVFCLLNLLFLCLFVFLCVCVFVLFCLWRSRPAVASLDLKGSLRSNDATATRMSGNDRFHKQDNNFVRVSQFFCTFLCRFFTTRTWKCLIFLRFMENVNKQRLRFFGGGGELGYGPLELIFSSFTFIWHSKQVGIIVIKTERRQIPFKQRSRLCRVLGSLIISP